ncbi:uncharacterized protein LOC134278880 [Saccostrea cucullata]|uniref:uncharacterized protein LOC134278880 n=1 Tax=Saccostrea cuccullata TaxID=36930 RepID=UPI002ED11CB4
MDILTFLLIMISFTVGDLSTIICPLNETEWNVRSKTKVCQGKDDYHCLVMEDGKTREEKCIERTLIMNGNCPIFTNDYYLHWRTCNKTGCPSIPYRSDEVYNFPVCFEIESEENNLHWSQQSRSKDDAFALKIGLPLGLIPAVLVISIVVILIIKKRRQTLKCLSGFRRNDDDDDDANDVPELRKLVKKPEYISIAVDHLKTKKIIYVIGQLGNSVSTSGKKITKIYAKRHQMSDHYYNYLDISQKFSEHCPEKVFKRKTVNFIDGWGGLWNENPCERKRTLDILVQVAEQSKSLDNTKFVFGLRTEIHERLKDELLKQEIRISEYERVLLDNSSIYKRKKVVEEINLLQNSCSDGGCGCKSLTFERVSEIDQVPIGTFLVVKLMSLDHKMIPDFLRRNIGPLKAVQNLFEGLMEDQTWPWLPYFVCLGYHDNKEFKQEIASEFDISEDMLSEPEKVAKYTKMLDKDKLAPMWSERFDLEKPKKDETREVRVFWHNFLYICAFHACYKKYPKQMIQFCNLDAILQLVRPMSHPDPLAIIACEKDIDLFCEERLKNLADDSVFKEHPLVLDWRKRKE